MPDVEVVAAPSAATEALSFEIPRSGTEAYANWRMSGELPEAKPKAADPAPADPSKETPSVEPVPEPGKKQEQRRKPDAEARIAELTARAKQLENELAEARKPKEAKADPPPARQPEQTRPMPKQDDKGPDGKPLYADYEEYMDARADWRAEQREAARKLEQERANHIKSAQEQIDKAKERYGDDFQAKIAPLVADLNKPDIPREVFSVMNDSPVLADVLYTIAGSEATRADFLKTCRENPSKALRVVLLMEQEITKELSKGSGNATETGRNDKGQFTKAEETAPAKPGPERTPNPPIEIGNRGGVPKDDSAGAADGDFRAFKRAQDAKDLKRLRGA